MPSVDLHSLPREDLTALAALKLMIEVGAEVQLAFDTWRAADRWACLGFLQSGAGTIGPDPVDAQTLTRARAWQAELARPLAPRPAAAEAVATFAALAAQEAEVWEDVSVVDDPPPRFRKRPCHTGDVVVVPVPGFVARGEPWGAQLGVTLTQLTMA